MKTFIRFSLLLFIALSSNLYSQVSRDVAVELDVVVDSAKPSITLQWKADPRATSIQVNRRLAGAKSWGTAKTVVKTDSLYRDTTVEIGKTYEYRVRKILSAGSTITAWGYVMSGINIPAMRDKGGVFLVVDSTYGLDLKNELERLENDLFSDGYVVTRINVSRNDKPTDVKEKISTLYLADPLKYTTVFLLGRVPVPYSGFLNPDGHPDHYGAWPADAYYGEFDSEWLDEDYQDSIVIYNTGNKDSLGNWILDTANVRKANYNITGDGKFDVISFSDDIDLQVGRVDFADMTAFGKTERELLKLYLDKDHNYRVGLMTAPKRGLIDDNFGYFKGEAFASSGWRNLPTMVGRDSVKEIDWFTTLSVNPYLWAYGTGGGWDQGAGGIGNTSDFASQGSKAIFTMLFGSYFGDWNTSNNFLRAPLATEYGLSCAWSGRPYWHFYPMGMGEPLGYCARKSQNNAGDLVYNSSATGVHIALMGDPTLKLYPVKPPTALTILGDPSKHTHSLEWNSSTDKNIVGYYIFRSPNRYGPYVLLTPQPIKDTSFITSNLLQDTNSYWVHAVRLEFSPSGSYYNLSPGVWGVELGYGPSSVNGEDANGVDKLSIYQTQISSQITLTLGNTSDVQMSVVDGTGRTLSVLTDRVLSQGEYHFELSYSDLSSGVYFIRVTGTQKPLSAKILVVK